LADTYQPIATHRDCRWLTNELARKYGLTGGLA